VKRRKFLQLCSASVALAAVPAALVAAPSLIAAARFQISDIEWKGMDYDWHSKYGLAGQVYFNNMKYRHAILFPDPLEDITESDINAGKMDILEHFNKIYLEKV
jgi:hypothetical protein